MTILYIILGLLVFFLILSLILRLAVRSPVFYDDYGDEEVTHTTTTTTTVVHDAPVQVPAGTLQRQFDNGQPFVIDPSDGQRWNLNTTDDMYEDAIGRIWQLV